MTTRAPSLLNRLIARQIFITLGALVVGYAWLFFEVRTTSDDLRDHSLFQQSQDIAAALSFDGAGDLVLNLSAPLMESYGVSNGRYRYAVRDEDKNIVLESGWPVGAMPAVAVDDEDGEIYEHGPDSKTTQKFYGLGIGARVAGRDVWIQVEQDAKEAHVLTKMIAEDFFEDGGWLGVPFLICLLGVSIWTIRRTLIPLNTISARAAAIHADQPGIRLPDSDVPVEVVPVVQAVNEALGRLEASYELQREFTADAAHELRTPLAVLSAQVDLIADREIAGSLRRSLDKMTRLVAQLLKAAQVDNLVLLPTEHADLHAVALDVAIFLGPLAIKQGREIEVTGCTSPVPVHGRAEAIFDAVRNLAENALAHSPVGGVITLDVSSGHALAVIDHGPGVAHAKRDLIFRRFWRDNRTVSGAGLGLSIVQKIAQSHGAELVLEDTPGGGATFILRFPSLPSAF